LWRKRDRLREGPSCKDGSMDWGDAQQRVGGQELRDWLVRSGKERVAMSDIEFISRQGPDFARLTRKFTVRSWDRDARIFAAAERPRLLHVREGEVAVAGQRILQPKFMSDTLYWSQKTVHGFSSAILHFTRDRLAFAGQIFSGPDETSA